MSEFAKFSATLGKMTVGDTETKIELVLSMKEVQKNFMFLTNNQKNKVLVSLGDPQVSMNFSDEEKEEPYRVYRADQHGLVEQMDNNQGDLLNPVAETLTDPYEGKEIVINEMVGEDSVEFVDLIFPIVNGNALLPDKYVNNVLVEKLTHEDVITALGLTLAPLEDHAGIRYSVEQLINEFDGELRDIPAEVVGPADHYDDEDSLEDWEKEIMGETNDDQVLIEQIDADIEQKIVDAEPVDIDTYILTNKPVVEGIEYDFPTLLQRKKSGETWMDLAKSLGIPSTQLSTAWSKYKKHVEKMLGNNGAA
jgi:hypothetical protein